MEQTPLKTKIFDKNKIGLHVEDFGEQQGLYTDAKFASWTQSLQEVSFRTAVSKTLSYGLCNANPDYHGLQEEEHQIGLKYNLNPLEKIEKEFNKMNLLEQFKSFLTECSTLICLLVGLYEFFKFMLFIMMT